MYQHLVFQFIQKASEANAQGNYSSAVSWCQQALKLNRNIPEAWYNLGVAYVCQHSNRQALEAFRKTAALTFNNADAQNSIGLQFMKIGEWRDAERCLRHALSIAPKFAFAHSNLGKLRRIQNRIEEAEVCFRNAIRYEPNLAPAYVNLSAILNTQRRFGLGKATALQAIELDPGSPEAWNNLSVSYVGLNDNSSAENAARHALEIEPKFTDAWNNLGVALSALCRIKEALSSFEEALDINSDDADARWNKSLLLLLLGDYTRGWEEYEWRWGRTGAEPRRQFNKPLWTGSQSVAGKTLLIYPEQGLGDYIQFCRYALQANALGAHVVLEAPEPLVSLVSTLPANFKVVASGETLPDFDFHCPVMSLPLAFKTTVDSISTTVPYLFPSSEKTDAWKRKFGIKSKIRVGLVWSGNLAHKNDQNRSIPAVMLEPILDLPFEFHILQKEIRCEDAKILEKYPDLSLHYDELNDFSDTAALIDAMDLVVSVDTSVAHVAGAMGKPIWLLLPFVPDFRWMLDRETSPWYPTAELLRQTSFGDWQGVISKIVYKLRMLICSS